MVVFCSLLVIIEVEGKYGSRCHSSDAIELFLQVYSCEWNTENLDGVVSPHQPLA